MRRVGVVGAVGIGVGSMLGAGVFVVWGPAASAAPDALLAAVVLAGVVAVLNAGSTAQLAAAHPVAGGAYAYGRAELGPWPGFLAGLGFVLGKTASIAAIGLAIGSYVSPGHAALVATVAIAASWALNSRGVTRTAGVSVVIAAAVLAVLLLLLGALALVPREFGWFAWAPVSEAPLAAAAYVPPAGIAGITQAAALIFFAFAGYARIATLGEEVRRPARTIPRAIGIALAVVLAVYAGFAAVLPGVLGDLLPVSVAPLADAAAATGLPAWVVSVAAVVAAAGSLLALTAGVGRTAMAMAREGDLPRALERRNARDVPALAEGASAAVAIALAWAGDLTFAIAMSSFAVLLYYAVANAAAFAARRRDVAQGWRMPLVLSGVGLALCVALASTLPLVSTLTAIAVLLVGAGVRAWRHRGTE